MRMLRCGGIKEKSSPAGTAHFRCVVGCSDDVPRVHSETSLRYGTLPPDRITVQQCRRHLSIWITGRGLSP